MSEMNVLSAVLDCNDVQAEFAKLIEKLDTAGWTAGEKANYFAFFCHGYFGRAGEAMYQAT